MLQPERGVRILWRVSILPRTINTSWLCWCSRGHYKRLISLYSHETPKHLAAGIVEVQHRWCLVSLDLCVFVPCSQLPAWMRSFSVLVWATVYAKTYNLMAKWKWFAPTYDCAHACMYYASTHKNIVYVHITIGVQCPGQNGFFSFSKAGFSKRLERFCFMLLLHTATMVETSRMPCFLFWNEYYRFAPNSKCHKRSRNGQASWTVTKKVLRTKSL